MHAWKEEGSSPVLDTATGLQKYTLIASYRICLLALPPVPLYLVSSRFRVHFKAQQRKGTRRMSSSTFPHSIVHLVINQVTAAYKLTFSHRSSLDSYQPPHAHAHLTIPETASASRAYGSAIAPATPRDPALYTTNPAPPAMGYSPMSPEPAAQFI